MKSFKVNADQVGQRLDEFLADKIALLSRSSIAKLIKNTKVQVNNSPEKPSYKLKLNDRVTLDYDLQPSIPKINLPIIYEDDACIVINKPVGVLSHSKGAFNPEATVASFIQDRLHGLSGERAGIVHRLDRPTSGVIIAAKTSTALSWLQKQFAQRKVKKTYIAVISGHIEPKQAIIDMPIERHPKTPKLFRVGVGGKPANTEYKVLKSSKNYDLVELKPQTGRTHQLRVHLKQQGHPIVGDLLYGGPDADRLYLHAQSLELTLPNRQRQTFVIKPPKEFASIIKNDG
ncbi:MAG TPA: RluA family pseudouridine synthase [Candidatus Saccharimonadales bacterium]|nr:RluA family pseudouridine synthase [Candidatus Saccharimonadales bacterium]